MKKKDQKKLDNIKKYLKDLDEKKDITDGDVDKLSNLIDEAVNGTKLERLLKFIIVFVIRFVAILVVTYLVTGILFSELAINNNLEVLYLCLITSFVLDIVDVFPFIDKKGINYFYFLLVLIAILIGVYINGIMPIFRYSSIWIVYILFILLFYNLIKIFLARRAYERLRDKKWKIVLQLDN